MVEIESGSELVKLILQGDTDRFALFYRLYFKKLVVEADKYTRDIGIAEELVQDLFLKIWENPETMGNVKMLKPYLYRAIINLSINYLNKQKRNDEININFAQTLTDDNLEAVDEENRMIAILVDEIDRLPPQCQKVFKMSRFDGLRYKQIGEVLGISERTVENHIATAVKQLKKVVYQSKNSVDDGSFGADKLFSLIFF